MKKYEFIKKGLDDWTLKYKNNEINFKTDIKLQKKAQGLQKDARVKMIMDLSKQGISAKDLEIETKKDGKTIIDETNKNELLMAYLEQVSLEFFEEVCKDKLGKDYVELIDDMELTDKEVEKFSEELALIISGKRPR